MLDRPAPSRPSRLYSESHMLLHPRCTMKAASGVQSATWPMASHTRTPASACSTATAVLMTGSASAGGAHVGWTTTPRCARGGRRVSAPKAAKTSLLSEQKSSSPKTAVPGSEGLSAASGAVTQSSPTRHMTSVPICSTEADTYSTM